MGGWRRGVGLVSADMDMLAGPGDGGDHDGGLERYPVERLAGRGETLSERIGGELGRKG
jgi:hypothetical protein